MKKRTAHGVFQNTRPPGPESPGGGPLQLNELLTLIRLAGEKGYSVKHARDLQASGDTVDADLFAAWFAVENELSIFAHNIPRLVEVTGFNRSNLELTEIEYAPDHDVAFNMA